MAASALRVLIVGGYGTFGGRLARLLAGNPRLHLIVAGRSLSAATKFCAALQPGAGREAAAFDRDGDVAAQIAALKPHVLVDASGPFQAYGAQPYRLVEACIGQAIHYIDLADGAAFVAGISAFDDAARAAGVFVLAGASTFPVLSAAVLRAMAAEGLQIEEVEGGIAPSPRAGLGRSVIRATALYAGKPVARLQDGRLQWDYALTRTRRRTVAPPGGLPLRSRLFALIDVPDLRLIPQLWPDLRSIWMGAGPAPAPLFRGFVLLAWLVRLRLLPSLAPLAGLFHGATRLLGWGEHRSGMFIAARGRDLAGRRVEKSWHLTAEGDDGPFVPAMAAAAIVGLLLESRPPAAGARAASEALELAQYLPWFAGRRIACGFRQPRPDLSLYRRVLDAAWDELPPALQAMHASVAGRISAGEATVERGRNPLARLAADLMRFPRAGERIAVRVTFAPIEGGEIWRRDFGGRSFSSIQTEGRGRSQHLIEERFGAIGVALACVIEGGRLRLIVRRWSLFGIAMPRLLSPGGEAFEYEQDGRFHFDVELKAPLLGRLVRYRGWLVPEA
ncbi:MAG: DUF4166 domain-containing protein [Reyranellaceae bacterium]